MVDLRDHAPNRHNRFVVAVEGQHFNVVNERTNQIAVHPSGRRYWWLDRAEASQVCAKLNRRAQQKRICKGCRHKRFADEIAEGRCAGCWS